MSPNLFDQALEDIVKNRLEPFRAKLKAEPGLAGEQPGRCPLLLQAVYFGRAEMLQPLLEAGADPNAVNNPNEGLSALHLAALRGDETSAISLLAAGAKVEAPDSEGLTPLDYLLESLFAYSAAEEAGLHLLSSDIAVNLDNDASVLFLGHLLEYKALNMIERDYDQPPIIYGSVLNRLFNDALDLPGDHRLKGRCLNLSAEQPEHRTGFGVLISLGGKADPAFLDQVLKKHNEKPGESPKELAERLKIEAQIEELKKFGLPTDMLSSIFAAKIPKAYEALEQEIQAVIMGSTLKKKTEEADDPDFQARVALLLSLARSGLEKGEKIFHRLYNLGARPRNPFAALDRAVAAGLANIVSVLAGALASDPARDGLDPLLSRLNTRSLEVYADMLGFAEILPQDEEEGRSPYGLLLEAFRENLAGLSSSPGLTYPPEPAGAISRAAFKDLGRFRDYLASSAPSPLVTAVIRGDTELIEILLDSGWDTRNQGLDARLALLAAMERQQPTCASMIYLSIVNEEQEVDGPMFIQPAQADKMARAMIRIHRLAFEDQEQADLFFNELAAALSGFPRPCLEILSIHSEDLAEMASGLGQYSEEEMVGLFNCLNLGFRLMLSIWNEIGRPEFDFEGPADDYDDEEEDDEDDYDDEDAWDEIRQSDAKEVLARNEVVIREERPLKEILAELEKELIRLDPRLPKLFNPGLTSGKIKKMIGESGPLNPELIDLYNWHNGFADAGEMYYLALFGDHSFMSLEQALDYKRAMAEWIPEHALPVMRNDFGDHFELSLTREEGIKALFCDAVHDDRSIFYPNAAAYFAAILSALKDGAFKVKKGGGENGEDILVVGIGKLYQALGNYWLRYNDDDESNQDEKDDEDTSRYELIIPAA